jgi:hypothetical protein
MVTTRNRVVFFVKSLPGEGTETDIRPKYQTCCRPPDGLVSYSRTGLTRITLAPSSAGGC